MSLWDKLLNIQGNGIVGNYGNIAAQLPVPEVVSGGQELAVQSLKPSLFNRLTGLGNKVYDGLFGKIVDNSSVGNDGTLSATINNPHREGGVLADLQSGFRENAYNGFRPENLAGNGGSFARKIGEGVGTLARFADSPLGRGVLVGGAIGALGGTPAEMLAYGAGTGAKNQGFRTADQLYRDNLAEQGVDLSNVKGYITPEQYRNLLYAKQLQDNAEYRNLYLDAQMANQEAMQQLKKDLLEYQKSKEDFDRQIALGNLALGQAKVAAYIQSLQNKANKTTEDKATLKQLNDNNATLADIDAGLQLIEQNPGAYSPIKGITPSWLLNYTDKKGISTRTQIDNITAVYRKWLTGAQMSDAERKAYERFLPAPTDNATAVKAKLQGMKNSIERKNNILMQGVNLGNSSGINVDMDAIDAELSRRGL